MLTTSSCTRNVKTDGDILADLVQQPSLDWQLTLHNDWNAHRLVALCVACFSLIGNANEKVHGAYGGASEGALLLVEHAQCDTPPYHGVNLARNADCPRTLATSSCYAPDALGILTS